MSKTFCPLPWIFLAIRNNGTLRVCCQSNISKSRGIIANEQGTPLNARDANIDHSRNEAIMKQTRLDMMKGDWPEPCIRCKTEEETGLNSRRQYETSNWGITLDQVKHATADDGVIDTEKLPLKYFDIRFGNRCNLACRMCGPTDSDSWYEDHVKLAGRNWFSDTEGNITLKPDKFNKMKDHSNSYEWYNLDYFWQQLEKITPGLAHIYLAGGEPLLIEEHYKFLEKCVAKGHAHHITLEYNTNLTILPPKALELWKSFKSVRIGASVDGIEKVLEYQRYPAKWINIERNLNNINRYIDLNSHVHAWLAFTVTVYNVFHIPEFIEWKLKSGLNNINKQKKKPILSHHMAHKPNNLNVRVLPDHLKSRLCLIYEESLIAIKKEHGESTYLAAKKIYDSIIKYTTSESYYDEHWPDFINYTVNLDSIRNQKHDDFLYPEISQEINIYRQG